MRDLYYIETNTEEKILKRSSNFLIEQPFLIKNNCQYLLRDIEKTIARVDMIPINNTPISCIYLPIVDYFTIISYHQISVSPGVYLLYFDQRTIQYYTIHINTPYNTIRLKIFSLIVQTVTAVSVLKCQYQ